MGDEPTDQPDDQPNDDDGASEDLRDAGKRALNEERRLRRQEAKRAKQLEDELTQLKTATATDSEKAIAQARSEARSEALKGINARVVRSEVRALAGGKFADPADAVYFLGDLDDYIDEDGEPDIKKIGRALDSVLKDKPYLRAGPPPPGNGDGGPRGENAAVDDFNSAFRRIVNT